MAVINIKNHFYKALRLLDLGETERASGILEEIVIEADKAQDSLFFIRANCVLGELLFSNGKFEEAKRHLTQVIDTPYEDDVVDYEKAIATDILSKIK